MTPSLPNPQDELPTPAPDLPQLGSSPGARLYTMLALGLACVVVVGSLIYASPLLRQRSLATSEECNAGRCQRYYPAVVTAEECRYFRGIWTTSLVDRVPRGGPLPICAVDESTK